MKKLSITPDIRIIRLDANCIVATSMPYDPNGSFSDPNNVGAPSRVFFDNGSYLGETFDNDYTYDSHYEQ